MIDKRTKNELLTEIKELEDTVNELRNDVDYWQKEYNDLDEIVDDLNNQIEDLTCNGGIKDLDNFIWRLKLDNLYTTEIETFIENYLKFYNK